MHLTTEQRATLKAAILADPTASVLYTDGNLDGLAQWCNAESSPAYYVYRTSLATNDIFDAIAWANFTPTGTPGADAAWTNRALACQGKQFNLQTMLVGRETLNPSKNRIRAGLQDALTDIPSGNNGNLRQGGWENVLPLLYRVASRLEAIFSTGDGTTLSPSKLGTGEGGVLIEGDISYTELQGL